MADIQLSGIRKSFGETRVLNGIDLRVRNGEFLTLVGPSGCGKSTLLRIIAGLEAQTEGDVSIGDRSVNEVRASDRDLAMVFQSYALYPHLTVRDNMLTPLRLRDLTTTQRLPLIGRFMPGAAPKIAAMRRMVAETADILKIEELLDRKPGQLSGGQRQRAALGRAMVRRPIAFLMDEPLSNLDAALRVHMRAELTDLHRRLETTFIYVTHDQAEALTMSTRVAVMMDGDILQLDTPETVYRDPASLRVAEFVGSPKINILDGELSATGVVSALGHGFASRIDGDGRRSVKVGLRPEHLSVVANSGPGDGFGGVVRHKENLGSDVFIHITVADGRASMTVRADPEVAFGLSHGDAVRVRLAKGDALVFGPDGGRLRSSDDATTPGATGDREVA
jgi:multiple sugar transport system ATP-binding protein